MVAGLRPHVDLDGIIDDPAPLGIAIVDIAAGFQRRCIALIDVGLGVWSVLLERSEIADVIEVPMSRGEDLDITRLEAERLDACLDVGMIPARRY